jgi:hypothetical protein
MRDELFDRDYQAGRDALNDGIDRLISQIGGALRALHAIQFDAPWKRDEDTTAGKSA